MSAQVSILKEHSLTLTLIGGAIAYLAFSPFPTATTTIPLLSEAVSVAVGGMLLAFIACLVGGAGRRQADRVGRRAGLVSGAAFSAVTPFTPLAAPAHGVGHSLALAGALVLFFLIIHRFFFPLD